MSIWIKNIDATDIKNVFLEWIEVNAINLKITQDNTLANEQVWSEEWFDLML